MPKLKVGSNRCQCPTCEEYFNSVAAFDKHRVGPHDERRRCLSVEEMQAAGFSLNAAGFWITDSRAQRAARRAAAALLEDLDRQVGGSTVRPESVRESARIEGQEEVQPCAA